VLKKEQNTSKYGYTATYKREVQTQTGLFYKNLMITVFSKSNTYFSTYTPCTSPLYTVAVAQAASLSPFQKKVAVARPATVAQKV
jgi:hypothetical protein